MDVKRFLLVIGFIFIVVLLHGCSNESSHQVQTDEMETHVGEKRGTSESETDSEQSSSENVEEGDDAGDRAKTEEAVEEESEDAPLNQSTSHYKSTNFDLELIIDPRLQDDLIVEEDVDSIQFMIEDDTVLQDVVPIGSIEMYPTGTFDEYENRPEMHTLFTSDSDDAIEYAYSPITESPYVTYRNGEEILPEEERFAAAVYLLERSLIRSGFLDFSIYANKDQELPPSLDQNKMAGITIAEDMLGDIKAWHSELKKGMAMQLSDDEWFDYVAAVGSESTERYPEIRQVPFPTFEIGRNISETIFSLQEIEFYPHIYGKKVTRMETENIVWRLENNIKIIEQQLGEIKRSFQ